MARHMLPGQMIFRDENANVHHTKVDAKGGTVTKDKLAKRKDAGWLGSRKALNDITNKSQPQPEASCKSKSMKENINIAEEGFLHDHKKCIEEQQKIKNAFDLELVLPGYGSMSDDAPLEMSEEKIDEESLDCRDEPEEMSMSEFSDWLDLSSYWRSPPCSPLRWDSLPSSPLSRQYQAVDFKLKEENCV